MTPNTFATWILIGILVLTDAVWLSASGLSLAPGALPATLLPVAGTAALAWFYTKIRRDRRIAALTHLIAVMLAFTAAVSVLSYLTVTLDRPLIDPYLVRADHAIGLDWPAMYAWVYARPWLHILMKLIYLSLVPQMIVLQLILTFRGQIARAWELQWVFALTCLGCLFFSSIWPAMGAFGYFHVEPTEPYVHEFAGLRAGTLKIIGVGGIQGVIQFPSLHTALAILYIYATRGVRVLFPLFAALNILVIATTPAIGGHHFADLWGGAVLALAAIYVVRQPFMTKLLAEPKPVKTKMPA